MGLGTRISLALQCFFSILFNGNIPQAVLTALGIAAAEAKPVAAPKQPAAESADRAIQMLALLQRDGRLVDFLAEDVSMYPDAQLGAAVRVIHDSCKQSLDRYVTLEPILAAEEDQPVALPPGFDPASIKLIGNLTGAPPARGLLRHRGWRIAEIKLPALPEGEARAVVTPAEVEIP
jgi:hypothetical protein